MLSKYILLIFFWNIFKFRPGTAKQVTYINSERIQIRINSAVLPVHCIVIQAQSGGRHQTRFSAVSIAWWWPDHVTIKPYEHSLLLLCFAHAHSHSLPRSSQLFAFSYPVPVFFLIRNPSLFLKVAKRTALTLHEPFFLLSRIFLFFFKLLLVQSIVISNGEEARFFCGAERRGNKGALSREVKEIEDSGDGGGSLEIRCWSSRSCRRGTGATHGGTRSWFERERQRGEEGRVEQVGQGTAQPCSECVEWRSWAPQVGSEAVVRGHGGPTRAGPCLCSRAVASSQCEGHSHCEISLLALKFEV